MGYPLSLFIKFYLFILFLLLMWFIITSQYIW